MRVTEPSLSRKQEPGQGQPPPKRFGMTMTALDTEKAVIIGGHMGNIGGEEVICFCMINMCKGRCEWCV